MRYIGIAATVATMALIFCAHSSGFAADQKADMIFHGGSIITVNDAAPFAKALAVKDGKIFAVGTQANVLKTKGAATRVVNLNGKILLPGFIDTWSHIGAAALLADFADLSFWGNDAPADFKGVFAKLRENQQKQSVKDGEWIVGWGYDPTYLKENRHPDHADLDAAFPNNPVAIVHLSGIMGVTNSAGLKILGISEASTDPVGGSIVRKSGTQEPTGLLQGMSFAPLASIAVGKPTMEQLRDKTPQNHSNLRWQWIYHGSGRHISACIAGIIQGSRSEGRNHHRHRRAAWERDGRCAHHR